MNSETGLNLTATDRVLIHLRDFKHHSDDREFPQAMTQKGISETAGLRLTHVPRTLKNLEDRGFIGTAKGHIIGEKRRYNVYFLTEPGLEEANGILKHLSKTAVCTPAGTVLVGDILETVKGAFLPILRELAGETVASAPRTCTMAGPIPEIDGFVDREHELADLEQMLADSKVRVMVIYGSTGYGTSALASKFIRSQNRNWSSAWVEVRKDLAGLVGDILRTSGEAVPGIDAEAKTPKRMAEQFAGKKMILVLDSYFDVTDEAVEFLTGFVAAIKGIPDFKLLVTAREDTPSYNRFYTIIDQHDGTVGEVHIRGLDMAHCQLLLGTPDIDPEAMKRLFMFTRGKPPTLKLLALGNEKELREHTSFSPEEIKLMLFLKGLKKE